MSSKAPKDMMTHYPKKNNKLVNSTLNALLYETLILILYNNKQKDIINYMGYIQ